MLRQREVARPLACQTISLCGYQASRTKKLVSIVADSQALETQTPEDLMVDRQLNPSLSPDHVTGFEMSDFILLNKSLV